VSAWSDTAKAILAGLTLLAAGIVLAASIGANDTAAAAEPADPPAATRAGVTTTWQPFRFAAQCNDGTMSRATGSGACSHHSGVAHWLRSDCTPAEVFAHRTSETLLADCRVYWEVAA
jgi:hypothetical protein